MIKRLSVILAAIAVTVALTAAGCETPDDCDAKGTGSSTAVELAGFSKPKTSKKSRSPSRPKTSKKSRSHSHDWDDDCDD
jgi:hypothetical protein